MPTWARGQHGGPGGAPLDALVRDETLRPRHRQEDGAVDGYSPSDAGHEALEGPADALLRQRRAQAVHEAPVLALGLVAGISLHARLDELQLRGTSRTPKQHTVNDPNNLATGTRANWGGRTGYTDAQNPRPAALPPTKLAHRVGFSPGGVSARRMYSKQPK